MGCQEIQRERNVDGMRSKKRELHELPYTEILKSGAVKTLRNSNLGVNQAA